MSVNPPLHTAPVSLLPPAAIFRSNKLALNIYSTNDLSRYRQLYPVLQVTHYIKCLLYYQNVPLTLDHLYDSWSFGTHKIIFFGQQVRMAQSE